MTISVTLWVILALAVCVLYFREGKDLDLQDRSDAEFNRFFGKQKHDAHVQAYLRHCELQSGQAVSPQAALKTVTI